MLVNTIILAAEGPNILKKDLPACLQQMKGGTTLLDYQIRTLNLCGINSENIYLVIGKQGIWGKQKSIKFLKKYSRENLIFNHQNESTNSADSFLIALEKINLNIPTIVINGDIFFDVFHLEKIFENLEKNIIFSKLAYSINEKGIKLKAKITKFDSIIEKTSLSDFPWNIYAGLTLIESSSIKLIKNDKNLDNIKSFIHLLQRSIGLEKFYNIPFEKKFDLDTKSNNLSIDLIGGSYAQISRKHLVRKIADGEGKQKLENEIDWLKSLPKDIKGLFPIVVEDYRNNNLAWYEMPYYDFPNLRKNIITGVFTSCEAFDFINNILDVLFEKVYSKIITINPDSDWIIHKYFLRVMNRTSETIKKSKILKEIISQDYIKINNKKYRNMYKVLKDIISNEKLIEILIPKQLNLIHGDLHFQNIFVGPLDNGKPFIIADPSGEQNGSDIFYDLGKIWHSINGLYDLIHTNLFFLEKEKSIHSYKMFFLNNDLTKIYSDLKNLLLVSLPKRDFLRNDEYWLLKILFAEAMHFCSVVPFHLAYDGKERKAIALYLRSVILINELNDYIEEKNIENKKTQKYIHTCDFNNWEQQITTP